MKHLLAAATALVLVTGNAQAMGCDEVDFALRGALQEALMGAEDRQVSGLALYLNEAFYTDLTCRLSKRHDRDAIDALIDDPEALMAEAMALTTSRNQSDALMLILMAMQATVDE